MKFNGALVKTDTRVIGVAVVDKSFVDKDPRLWRKSTCCSFAWF